MNLSRSQQSLQCWSWEEFVLNHPDVFSMGRAGMASAHPATVSMLKGDRPGPCAGEADRENLRDRRDHRDAGPRLRHRRPDHTRDRHPAVSAVESYAMACATLSRTAEAQPEADQVAYFLSEWQALTPPPGVDSYHAAILGVYRAVHEGVNPDTSALKDAYLSLHPDVQVALYDLGCIAQPPV